MQARPCRSAARILRVNQFQIQHQVLVHETARSCIPLRIIRESALETDAALFLGRLDDLALAKLLKGAPQLFPNLRSFFIRLDEVCPDFTNIGHLLHMCTLEPANLLHMPTLDTRKLDACFMGARRFVLQVNSAKAGFELVVTQGPEARLWMRLDQLPSDHAELQPFAQVQDRSWGLENRDDAVRWAGGLKRNFDTGDADARLYVQRVMPGRSLAGG